MVRFLLFFGILSMLLMGCDTREKTKIIYVRQVIPESVLECKAIPKGNLTETSQQDSVAIYVTNLHATATDCKSKLGTVKRIQEEAKAKTQSAQ